MCRKPETKNGTPPACSAEQNRSDLHRKHHPRAARSGKLPSAGKEGGAWGGRETTPLKKRCLYLPKKHITENNKEKHVRASAGASRRELQIKQSRAH